jgi:predicted metalloprotease
MSIDMYALATKNKLYSAGKVPAVRCRPPTAPLRSKAALLAHGRIIVDCMYRAWSPLVARADFYAEPPALAAYSDAADRSTVCGAPPANSDAFYCSEVRTILFDWEVVLEDPDDPEWSLVDFHFILAHEYGHYLQDAVGIMSSYNHDSASAAVRLEDERRLELQASCLGAAFLGANRRALQLTGERHAIFEEQIENTGDENSPDTPRDHGSRKSHAYWASRAFESGSPASCNTFTAPAKRVS